MRNQNRLSVAVRLALSLGLVSTAGLSWAQDTGQDTGNAQQQNAQGDSTTKPKSSEAKNLQAVVVTGSLIRRVDAETASPVVTLDSAALANNGSPTLGNVLQALPSFSGLATNPSNNSNGGGIASPTLEGGDGASRLSLRGLGFTRTLMLVDGQRLANPDLNMIPSNMIERVDVLAEGATTAYGSDAIGGVANFILRKDFSGGELSINDGISSHGDGQRRGASFTVGASGDQGNIVGGINYNKYSPVLASQRGYSSHQYYLYSSGLQAEGSSNIPNGKVTLPAGALQDQFGCSRLTRGSGSGSSLGDYRCFANSDYYNYNAYNYIQTSQERTSAFVLGNYKISDGLTWYIDAFYNHTDSAGQDAPEPTSTGDGWTIAADNPNNPFGIEFCNTSLPSCTGGAYNTRLTGAGNRLHTYGTNTYDVITGLRGNFGKSTWTWDLDVDYGHSERVQKDYNELNVAGLQAAIDAGANIFDQTTLPTSVTDNPVYSKNNSSKQVSFNASGELWDLPAGAVQLSAGALYRKEQMDYQVTSDAILDPDTLNCGIAAEGCASPGRGSFNVKELYAEALIPLLSDAPFAKSLNLDLGIRSSDYNTTGTTTNKKVAVEWKPIDDLLVRGTVSQVFRAPNLDELYDGLTGLNPTVTDPCQNLSAAQLAQHANLCQNVPVGYSVGYAAQITALYQGGANAGTRLRPEQGKSFDFGLVYSPSWATGLSSTLDFWRINLSDYLQAVSAQTVLNVCAGDDGSPYCAYINRNPATSATPGALYYIYTPEVNLGNLSTSGVDFNVSYVIPHFDLGSFDPGRFKLTFNSTYTDTYRIGMPGTPTQDYAGTYSAQFGNIARWRGSATLNWVRGNWNAQWQTRYIGHFTLLNAYYDVPGSIPRASATYDSIKLGYTVPAIHMTFDVGVDNLTNRLPPLIYQNGMNYNVDTATYDTLGRYYWARATLKF